LEANLGIQADDPHVRVAKSIWSAAAQVTAKPGATLAQPSGGHTDIEISARAGRWRTDHVSYCLAQTKQHVLSDSLDWRLWQRVHTSGIARTRV
jgi:hypothetical protein